MSRKIARRARFAYLARERRQDRSEVARIKRLYADALPFERLAVESLTTARFLRAFDAAGGNSARLSLKPSVARPFGKGTLHVDGVLVGRIDSIEFDRLPDPREYVGPNAFASRCFAGAPGFHLVSTADSITRSLPDGSSVYYGGDSSGRCFYERTGPDGNTVKLTGAEAQAAIERLHGRARGAGPR